MAESLEPTGQDESVLSRWSRLKRGTSGSKSADSAASVSPPEPHSNKGLADLAEAQECVVTPASAGSGNPALAQESSAELPPLDEISLERDFTPFMQAKVPEVLKRQALKTLFKDPHFNVMDGLDIYIDDYTKFEPITAEELEGLSAWKSISKPLQQVVTPGGYAVDIESEEGKAVLAAREQLAALTEARESDPTAAAQDEETWAVSSTEPVQQLPSTSPRYGKRVGDFRYVDPNPPALPDVHPSQPIPSNESPILATTDDPR